MLFSSISFLYYFLPFVLILYHIVPKQWKNGALLLASLVFYAWGEPEYVFLMVGMILLDYLAGNLIGKYGKSQIGRAIFVGILTVNVGVLSVYKFSDVAWPIGISFYTFQLISYLVDVYRGSAKAQENLISLGAYVTMFPQLIAGPIVRYVDIEKQLRERKSDFEDLFYGISRFIIGLGKKILISNALGELCAIFAASEEKSIAFYWICAVSYMLQIYFDFSGYSDMAIGLGKILGFDFLENFNYPYISGSITEFWRRWHISLGSWFRDYVYIPLGGNRVSKSRWYLNILIVWVLTGLWHGAALNFVLWGLMFAILLIIEKRWLLPWLEKRKILSHLYVLFVVLISFVIFQAADLGEAVWFLKGMFGGGKVPFLSAECVYYFKSYGILLGMAAVGTTPLVKNTGLKIRKSKIGKRLVPVIYPAGLILIFFACTAYLIDSSFNPFLYFRF